MNEYTFWKGVAVGFAALVAAIFLLVYGSNIQDHFTKKQCDLYGKVQLGDKMYSCSALNGAQKHE